MTRDVETTTGRGPVATGQESVDQACYYGTTVDLRAESAGFPRMIGETNKQTNINRQA